MTRCAARRAEQTDQQLASIRRACSTKNNRKKETNGQEQENVARLLDFQLPRLLVARLRVHIRPLEAAAAQAAEVPSRAEWQELSSNVARNGIRHACKRVGVIWVGGRLIKTSPDSGSLKPNALPSLGVCACQCESAPRMNEER